jgi:multiple sugar transport system substrate-binding protein
MPDSSAAIFKAVKQYEKANNVSVTLESVDPNTLDDKLIVAVKAGGGPDVVSVDINNAPTLASAGVLKNIGSYFNQIRSNFTHGMANTGTYGGIQYSVPWYPNNLGLLVNPAMLEKAGIGEAPKTWNELTTAATVVSNGTVYGLMLGAGGYGSYMWWPFLWQNGGSTLESGDKKVAFGSDVGVESWEYLSGLYLNHHAVPPAFVGANSSWDQITAPFAQQLVAMTIIGDFGIQPVVAAAPKLKFEVAPLPRGKEAATITGGFNLAIPRSSHNVTAAWDFISWMVNSKQIWILDDYDRMSALKDISGSAYAKNPLHAGFVEQAAVAHALPPVPDMGNINWNFLANAWSATILGQGSPESELLNAASQSSASL